MTLCSIFPDYSSLLPLASLKFFSIQQKDTFHFLILDFQFHFSTVFHTRAWQIHISSPSAVATSENRFVCESCISEISFASATFHQIAPCFFLSIPLFHTLAFSSNTAFSSILIPCQPHLKSFLSLNRFSPDKSNNTNPSSFSSALEKSAYFLFPFILLWGPVSPVYLLHIGSLLHYSLWYMNFSLSVLLAFHHYSIPLVTELLTLQCIFENLIHNHDYQYFHAIKVLSKKRYIILCPLNILIHLDTTLWMLNWQVKFNKMKAVSDFLTCIPYLLNFPGRSNLF